MISTAHHILTHAEADFAATGWTDAEDALREIEGFAEQAREGHIPDLDRLKILFRPAGPLHEVSKSVGWEPAYLFLAGQFEEALSFWNESR